MLMLSLFRSAAAAIPWMLNLATWLLARSLNMPRTAGARHRRLRVRAGADDREQGRQGALPDAAAASAPVAAAPLIDPRPTTSSTRRTVMIHPSTFLSRALLADAIFSGVSAVALTLGAGALAPFLNLPEALLRETGLFLIAYTALVGWLATRLVGAEGAGAARDRGQRRMDARQHRAVVLGRGVAEPARSGPCRGAGDRDRRVCGAAVYRPAQERRGGGG